MDGVERAPEKKGREKTWGRSVNVVICSYGLTTGCSERDLERRKLVWD